MLEYSENYSKISGCLWNYYGYEVHDDANENNDARIMINNNKTVTGKSFEYKTELMKGMPTINNTLDAEVVIPLKYLSNFWRSYDLPLINGEIEIDLS